MITTEQTIGGGRRVPRPVMPGAAVMPPMGQSDDGIVTATGPKLPGVNFPGGPGPRPPPAGISPIDGPAPAPATSLAAPVGPAAGGPMGLIPEPRFRDAPPLQPIFQPRNPSLPPMVQPRDPSQLPNFSGGQMGPYQPGVIAAPGGVGASAVGGRGANAGDFNIDRFRPFADAVMAEQRRQLDPRFSEQESAFRQRMVNQGIQEGSGAYDTALANFERSRNDAYSSAQNQALAQALGAQGQFFGQSLSNAQLGQQADLANAANQLQASQANAQLGLQAEGMRQAERQFGSQFGMRANELANAFAMQRAGLGEQQRQFDAGFGQQQRQFGAGLGEQQRQFDAGFGQQQRQFGAGLGEQQRQFDAGLGFQGQRADMQDLMSLLGFGQAANQYNNQQLLSDQQRAGALFGLIPGLTPTQLDVQGVARMGNENNQMGFQAQQQQQQALMQGLGSLAGGAMMMSDRRLKTDIVRVGSLDNGLPVYSYRYTFGGPVMIGLIAQEVLELHPDAVANMGEFLAVDYERAVMPAAERAYEPV